MIKKCILLIIFYLSLLSVQAQNDFFKTPVWSISVYHHSVGLSIKKPINVGFTLGAEFTYKQKEVSSWHQKVEIGFFHHKNLNKALYLKTDIVNRYTTKNGFYGEAQIGVGYLYDMPAYQPFVLDENGSFQASNLSGKSGFISSLGLGAGYQFTTNEKLTIAPFIRYEGMIQLPYSEFVPVFPHSLLHIGSRIKL